MYNYYAYYNTATNKIVIRDYFPWDMRTKLRSPKWICLGGVE